MGVEEEKTVPLQFYSSCWGSPRDQLIGSPHYQEVLKGNKYLPTPLADQNLACPWRQQPWSAGCEKGNNSSHAPKDHTPTWWAKGKYGHLGELHGDHLIQRQNPSCAVGGSWKTNGREEREEHSRKNKRGWKVHKIIKKEPSYSLLADYWHRRLDTSIWQGSASGMHTTGTYPVHCTHSPPTHKTSPGPSLGLFQLGNPPRLWCHPPLGLEFISSWLVQPKKIFFFLFVYIRGISMAHKPTHRMEVARE